MPDSQKPLDIFNKHTRVCLVIVKHRRTIIWMGRYIRNKLLLLLLYSRVSMEMKQSRLSKYILPGTYILKQTEK